MVFFRTSDSAVRRGFLAGLCAGLTFIVCVTGLALLSLQTKGITVRVRTAQIAAGIGTDLKAHMSRELNLAAAEIQRDLPERVAAAAAARLGAEVVQMGGLAVRIPDGAVQRIRSHLADALRAGMEEALTADALARLAGRLGIRVDQFVAEQLKEVLSDWRPQVQLWPGIMVRLRILPVD